MDEPISCFGVTVQNFDSGGLNLASNYWKAWLKESLEQTFLDRKLTVKKKNQESESNGMKPETKMGTYI